MSEAFKHLHKTTLPRQTGEVRQCLLQQSCAVTRGSGSGIFKRDLRNALKDWGGICVEPGGSFWHKALTDGCSRQQTATSLSYSASGVVLVFQTHT